MALFLARWVSPALASLLGLTDIRIQGRFGDPHEFTDVLHGDLFLLVELHRPSLFVRGRGPRAAPPAYAPGSAAAQIRLRPQKCDAQFIRICR